MCEEIIVKKDGKLVRYWVLFKLDDEKKNKKYYVYTDDIENKNGDADIYVSEYKNGELLEINSDEEMDAVKKAVEMVEDGVLTHEN